MLKKLRFLVFAGVLLICLIPLAAGAYIIDYTFDINGNEYISPYDGDAGFVTENFAGDTPGLLPAGPWTWTGNAVVLNGDVSTFASAPFGVSTKDTSNYVSVPKLDGGGIPSNTVTVTNLGLGSLYNYFGLWWGSVDDYNTLTFYKGGDLVETVNGSQISPADGNQTDDSTNKYVNIMYLPLYDSFAMSSYRGSDGRAYALESDNLTIGTVPEPATMLLLGLGLLGVAGIRRKFKG